MSIAAEGSGTRGFRAVVFDGEHSACAVLRAVRGNRSADSWTMDVAIVSRNRHGVVHARTDCTPDCSAPTDTPPGASTGAMLSLVYGMGALMQASANPGSRVSASFGAALTDDRSALLLVADEAADANFVAALAPFEGQIIGHWRA